MLTVPGVIYLEACLIMNGFRHDHFQTAGVVFFYFAASSA